MIRIITILSICLYVSVFGNPNILLETNIFPNNISLGDTIIVDQPDINQKEYVKIAHAKLYNSYFTQIELNPFKKYPFLYMGIRHIKTPPANTIEVNPVTKHLEKTKTLITSHGTILSIHLNLRFRTSTHLLINQDFTKYRINHSQTHISSQSIHIIQTLKYNYKFAVKTNNIFNTSYHWTHNLEHKEKLSTNTIIGFSSPSHYSSILRISANLKHKQKNNLSISLTQTLNNVCNFKISINKTNTSQSITVKLNKLVTLFFASRLFYNSHIEDQYFIATKIYFE